MATARGVAYPYFRRFTNTAAIATLLSDASLTNQEDNDIYRWYNYILFHNSSTEDVILRLDGNSNKAIFVPAGFSVELDGKSWFTNVVIHNPDTGTVAASTLQLQIGNRGSGWEEALKWVTSA